MAGPRLTRRLAGVIAKRIPELKFHLVADSRKARGKRWRLQPLLRVLLTGVIAGCKGLGQVERLTDEMTGPARRLLGIFRRVPDTTMRDLLLGLDPEQLRGALHHLIRRAWRRGALPLDGLPFGVLSLDGKVVATNTWDADGRIAQVQRLADGGACGLVRTVTSCLISCAARVCVDMHIIPPQTNESGVFGDVLRRLVGEFGDLFAVVMYDSGANARANARLVLDLGRHYVFSVKAEQPHLLSECKRQLGRRRAAVTLHAQRHPALHAHWRKRAVVPKRGPGDRRYPAAGPSGRPRSLSASQSVRMSCYSRPPDSTSALMDGLVRAVALKRR